MLRTQVYRHFGRKEALDTQDKPDLERDLSRRFAVMADDERVERTATALEGNGISVVRAANARTRRAPPRLDDRRSQFYRGSGWELGAECAVGKQMLPASLQLSSAQQRIRLRSDSPPIATSWLCDEIPVDPAGLSGEQAPSPSERFDHRSCTDLSPIQTTSDFRSRAP